MRILLYVEPHPIRNSYTHFSDVYRQFAEIVTGAESLDIRIYGNITTLNSLEGDLFNKIKDRLVWPTSEDEDLFKSHYVDWDSKGLEIWRSLIVGESIADQYVDVLTRIWAKFPFDVIVHWGDNGAVTKFIADLPVERIAMELGATRPPYMKSVTMDPFGTNGNGLLSRLDISDVESIVEGRETAADTALLSFSENIEALGYENQFRGVTNDVFLKTKRTRKIAFLPLQLYDDANLLVYSAFNRIADVVSHVVPALVEAGYDIIIKPHPGSRHRISANLENEIAREKVSAYRENIFWLGGEQDEPSNSQLIARSDLIVTVNSSVGFEALYHDKVVVVLGSASYKPKNLFPTLEQVCSNKFDLEKYLLCISYLRTFMLEYYLISSDIMNSSLLFYNRIASMSAVNSTCESSAVDFAGRCYRAFAPGQRRHFVSEMFAGRTFQQRIVNPKPTAVDVMASPSVGERASADDTDVARSFMREAVGRLVVHSGFDDEDKFLVWFNASWSDKVGLRTILSVSEIFVAEEYLTLNKDVNDAGVDALTHYTTHGSHESRAPSFRLKPVSMSQLYVQLENAIGRYFADSPSAVDLQLVEQDAHEWMRSLANLRAALNSSKNKIAVVAHLFYRDLVSEVLEELSNIDENFDLIVTLPMWGNRKIIHEVKLQYPNAIFCPAPNRGRDIGPFMDVLPILIEKQYDAVLKIHTKRGYYVGRKLKADMGKAWRRVAFGSLLGSKSNVRNIVAAFRARPKLRMLGSAPLYVALEKYLYHDRGDMARQFIARRNESRPAGFFAGTMFWLRPSCLKPLVTGPNALSLFSFEAENGGNDGSIAHVVERLMGELAGVERFGIATIKFDDVSMIELSPAPTEVSIHDYLSGKSDLLLAK